MRCAFNYRTLGDVSCSAIFVCAATERMCAWIRNFTHARKVCGTRATHIFDIVVLFIPFVGLHTNEIEKDKVPQRTGYISFVLCIYVPFHSIRCMTASHTTPVHTQSREHDLLAQSSAITACTVHTLTPTATCTHINFMH